MSIRCVASVGLLVVLALASGCAPPSESDEPDQSGSAVTTGARFLSDLEVGVYDARNAQLAVTPNLSGLDVWMEFTGRDGYPYFFYGAVDRAADGKLTVKNRRGAEKISIVVDGDRIHLRGDVEDTFTLRPAGALDGSYSARRGYGRESISISGSSFSGRPADLALTLAIGGKKHRAIASADASALAYEMDIEDCEARLNVTRKRGAFELVLKPKNAFDGACTMLNEEIHFDP